MKQRFQWLPLVSQVGVSCIINFLSRLGLLNPASLLSCVARAIRPSAAIFPLWSLQVLSSLLEHVSPLVYPLLSFRSEKGPRTGIKQKLTSKRRKKTLLYSVHRSKFLDKNNYPREGDPVNIALRFKSLEPPERFNLYCALPHNYF